jgi:uncharacterized membrane protein
MKQQRMTAHYDAPIEKVFALGLDYQRYPEWNVSYVEIKEVIGPPGAVGTKVHAVMRTLGRQMEGWAEIVEIDPPRRIKTTGSATTGGQLDVTYRLTPAGTGTDFELEVEYELPAGIFGQIADRLFIERAIERDLRHSLENFKALVEAPEPALV